jgi:hypothetical protein
MAATVLFRWLTPNLPRDAKNVLLAHDGEMSHVKVSGSLLP